MWHKANVHTYTHIYRHAYAWTHTHTSTTTCETHTHNYTEIHPPIRTHIHKHTQQAYCSATPRVLTENSLRRFTASRTVFSSGPLCMNSSPRNPIFKSRNSGLTMFLCPPVGKCSTVHRFRETVMRARHCKHCFVHKSWACDELQIIVSGKIPLILKTRVTQLVCTWSFLPDIPFQLPQFKMFLFIRCAKS